MGIKEENTQSKIICTANPHHLFFTFSPVQFPTYFFTFNLSIQLPNYSIKWEIPKWSLPQNLSCTNRLLFVRNEPSAKISPHSYQSSKKDHCLCYMMPFTWWEGRSYGSEMFVFMKVSRSMAERLHLKSEKIAISLKFVKYLIEYHSQ